MREQLHQLCREVADPGERLKRQYDVIRPVYECDPLPEEDEAEPFDARAHTETWEDMVRLQEEQIYPRAFAAITSPAIMLHGEYDPHPGPLIYASLLPHLPQLEYRAWPQCGHSPWRERAVREEFFAVLRGWLWERMG
jgi:pimeloyl-ACP methyl ester carboxylesterase